MSPSQDLSAMQSNQLVKSVRLMAREETSPPPGLPDTPDRPIGFAAVFLQLENPQQTDVTVEIQRIEICNAQTGKVQLAQTTPQTIRLRPLENSTNDFHLTNRSGYLDAGPVKAIVTYQIAGQTQVIESSAIAIERH
jgi:hypothetical protein